MRWLVLLAIGCRHPHAAVGNTERGDQTLAAAGDCTARIEHWKPGNRDRYAFEDRKTGKRGFKDKRGKVVIPARFNFAYEFSPAGIAAAVDNGAFVFIDPTGAVIARAYAFDNGPDYFQEGFARIVDGQHKIGYMTEAGVIAIPPRFDAAAGFCHGKAEVDLAGESFYIDTKGSKTEAPPRAKPDPDD